MELPKIKELIDKIVYTTVYLKNGTWKSYWNWSWAQQFIR